MEPKVSFRALEPEDADLLYEIENDLDLQQHGDSVAPYSRRGLLDYALTYDPDPFRSGQLRMAILNEGKEAVGFVDLYEISPKNRNAFIGIVILPQFRKQGYGLAAINYITDYSFRTLSLETVGTKILSDNVGAKALFEKAGFKEVGILKHWQHTSEGFKDVLLMQK